MLESFDVPPKPAISLKPEMDDSLQWIHVLMLTASSENYAERGDCVRIRLATVSSVSYQSYLYSSLAPLIFLV